jgi:hypothetical protein
MAKRIFNHPGQTWAPSATNVAASNWMSITGGSTTQIIDILEVLISGTAAAAAVLATGVRLSSATIGTPTALAAPATDGPLNVSASALSAPAVMGFAATTGPVPSNAATVAALNLGLNAFGGIIRWNASPFQQWTQVGSAAVGSGVGGISVLWNNSGPGGQSTTAAAHIIYEPY